MLGTLNVIPRPGIDHLLALRPEEEADAAFSPDVIPYSPNYWSLKRPAYWNARSTFERLIAVVHKTKPYRDIPYKV
jgi:hypothetical protein